MAYRISDKCLACGACEMNCPVGAISMGENDIYVIDKNTCIMCGACAAVCPVGAPEEEE